MTQRLRTRAALALIAGLLVLVPGGVAGGQPPQVPLSVADAARFDQKLTAIAHYAARASAMPFRPDRARHTIVTEAETNAYLRFRIKSDLPAGLADPYIAALGSGRLSGRAVVDLDAVRRGTARSAFDPAQLLTGRLPVSVTGLLRTRSGIATFEMESASISGIPVPRALLQMVVSHYTRSAEHPDGVSLGAQFVLPAGIREIDIQAHQAVIVQ